MKKIILLGLIFSLVFVSTASGQQSDSRIHPIPEKNGDYPDPAYPGIRIRVFVHEPKGESITAQAVCTDPDSDAVVDRLNWHLPNSVTYRLNTNSVPSSVGSTNLSTIATNSFAQWTNALVTSPTKPAFTEGATTKTTRSSYDGQNIIAWGRTQGSALAVTYTRYNSTTGVVVDVDTIMNLKFLWSYNGGSVTSCGDPKTYDAQNILTHELGHWMGLNDKYTSAYIDNTMYGYGQKGEVKKDTLTSGDTSGVQVIYP